MKERNEWRRRPGDMNWYEGRIRSQELVGGREEKEASQRSASDERGKGTSSSSSVPANE